ncbi:hypothetical protein AAMO2058_001268200 [Amorphochlora amoebiformis]
MASHPSRANALSLALSLLSLSPPPHSHTPYHSEFTTPGLEKSYTLIGPQWDDIKRVSHEGKAGDVVILFDRNDKFLGVGLLSEKNGRIRVRVLSLKRVKVDQEWLTTRGIRAAQKRHFLFPNPGRTNAYRVVNGENDGLGGFVCDKYNDTLVIKLYSASWFRYLESMVDGLSSSIPGTNRVVLLLSRGLQGLSVEERNGYENAQTLRG